MKCKICGAPVSCFSHAVVLNKYDISYFRCQNCSFIQTEEPYWLEESYSSAIASTDVGLVSRNLESSKITKSAICLFFNKNAQFIDYGGGYGLMVRLMRDKGFNFCYYDKYCSNLFANEFHLKNSNERYELVTAFEIFEHLIHPVDEIEHMLRYSKSILFTTQLVPFNVVGPEHWWYFALETGQHISLFSYKSLIALANRFDLNIYSNGTYIHMLTEKKISNYVFQLLFKCRGFKIIDFLYKKKSLLQADYSRLTGKKMN